MKEATKWMWALGDYSEVARHLQPHAEAPAAALDIRPGMEALNAATDGRLILDSEYLSVIARKADS